MTQQDNGMSNRLNKAIRDIRQRMVRTESRVTSFMRYNGFQPGRDLDVEKVNRVYVDHERGEIHATSPDVPVGLLLDSAIDTSKPSLALFVSGVRCGTIDPSQPLKEDSHDE